MLRCEAPVDLNRSIVAYSGWFLSPLPSVCWQHLREGATSSLEAPLCVPSHGLLLHQWSGVHVVEYLEGGKADDTLGLIGQDTL